MSGPGGFPGDGNDPSPNDRYPIRAFKSTPLFIEALTDLSVKVLHDEKTNKKEVLIDGLKKINENLPSNVYIPFVRH